MEAGGNETLFIIKSDTISFVGTFFPNRLIMLFEVYVCNQIWPK